MPKIKFRAATAAGASALLAALFAAIAPNAAHAAKPEPWGMGMQPSASPFMDQVHDFHTLLLIIITAVTVFVLGLLVYVILRFRESANPTPSRVTHNTLIEVVWTVVPVLILVVIAVPSFRLIYAADNAGYEMPITIKARGHQWNWSYVYLKSLKLDDNGKVVNAAGTALKYNRDSGKYENGDPVKMLKTRFLFRSNLLCQTKADCDKASKKLGRPAIRLLDVDMPIIIPVGVRVRLLVEGMDVIHSFAMPSMGVKIDAVPGRNNETWLYAKKPGMYYGQCSEICGRGHAYMPIAIKAVTPAEYAKWLADAQAKASAGQGGFEKYEVLDTKKPTKTSSLPQDGKSVAAKPAK